MPLALSTNITLKFKKTRQNKMKNTSLTNNRERFGRKVEETWWYIKKRKKKILRVTFKSGYLYLIFLKCALFACLPDHG